LRADQVRETVTGGREWLTWDETDKDVDYGFEFLKNGSPVVRSRALQSRVGLLQHLLRQVPNLRTPGPFVCRPALRRLLHLPGRLPRPGQPAHRYLYAVDRLSSVTAIRTQSRFTS
jgi:hypothetical protein